MESPAQWLGQRLDKLSGQLKAQNLADTREDAEDLVQDLVIRLLEGEIDLGLARNLGAYLWQALRNRALDRKRSKAYREAHSQSQFDEAWMQLPVSSPEPAGFDLASALMALPQEQSEVIRSHSIEGRGYAELAKAWGIPAGTLMARHKRGMDKLRNMAATKRQGVQNEHIHERIG